MKFRIADQDEAVQVLPGVDPLTAVIMFNRGVKTLEQAQSFLSPDFVGHSHDPFKMKDMEKAVERVLEAIEKGERIAIFSDYDADGIPGAVMWDDFFSEINFNNYEIYIPDRHKEGFGLNIEAVEELSKSGANLIITLDCGIGDAEEVERANELGMDVIITDHHEVGLTMPKAYAILNPKQSGCYYPEKMLCGSGVAYKFISAILEKNKEKKLFQWNDGREKWLLDMVGIATLSDMVPLLGENRTLASFGLKVLGKSRRVGLRHMFSSLGIDQSRVCEDDIGFLVSPRINVASRMASPRKAFNLLSARDESEAMQILSELEHLNNERKGLVASIVKEIKGKIREAASWMNEKVLVVGHSHWRPAVLGLASNTIMKEFGKPVFVWGKEDGDIVKGSCRSDGSVNLMELMSGVRSGIFSDFGGHAMSGGFSVEPHNIHDLGLELNRAYESISKKSVEDEIVVDARLEPGEVNRDTWRKIAKCAPFGTGNPKPLFILENLYLDSINRFGKAKDHIELRVSDGKSKPIKAIEFFKALDQKYSALVSGQRINLLANMEESCFRSYPEYRLRIVDII